MTSGFQPSPTQSWQTQKMARGLKFWIEEVEGMLCRENQRRGNRAPDLLFLHIYAKSRFYH